MAFVTFWLIEKELFNEHKEKWEGFYEDKKESEIPEYANVVSSNAIFRVK